MQPERWPRLVFILWEWFDEARVFSKRCRTLTTSGVAVHAGRAPSIVFMVEATARCLGPRLQD